MTVEEVSGPVRPPSLGRGISNWDVALFCGAVLVGGFPLFPPGLWLGIPALIVAAGLRVAKGRWNPRLVLVGTGFLIGVAIYLLLALFIYLVNPEPPMPDVGSFVDLPRRLI